MNVAWCITGAEMFLRETIELIMEIGPDSTELFLSKSATEILTRYGLIEKIKQFKMYRDDEASLFQITRLFSGRFNKVVIAPCSTNTVAKMAHGISDNLVTNIFSQANKIKLPIYILPSDTAEVMQFQTKSGKTHILFQRKIDRENIKKLKKFENVKVLNALKDLQKLFTAERK
ncbi:MAG TPA: flavoprotein [Candidatus Hydrothermia bacterium]|nr:flavoprotein [Candidatus Hydrothermia bacterium]HOK23066.1 flavoprotein [Candidatus Hydrothermia bacterium]HOL23674.1 flavoprotein [Candidatus Hydrothermia bacterium]HOP32091.1 flavoprotein [Candidatus Hydrothermia bacterium]HPO78679.1 flavoprotein [Candidatus Hydrothermia bacterium]